MKQNRNKPPEIDPTHSISIAKKALEKTNREYVPKTKIKKLNIRQYTAELKENMYNSILTDILEPYAKELTNQIAKDLKGFINENIDNLNALNKQKRKV